MAGAAYFVIIIFDPHFFSGVVDVDRQHAVHAPDAVFDDVTQSEQSMPSMGVKRLTICAPAVMDKRLAIRACAFFFVLR
jgi:hypothetical protein